MKDWIKDLDNIEFGSGVYSQSYQDKLLSLIFENIGTTNETPYCVEFGFNSSELNGGSGANTADLILNKKWDSLLLDGGHENPEINLHRHLLSSTNICEVFQKYNVPQEPEYVSIDVDSTDLWLFDALLDQYRAMVFTVEYNPHFPLDRAITFPNAPDMPYEQDRGYGASLKALTMVAEKHGYSLLWVVPKLDAVFIRNDLIDDGTDSFVRPLESWRNCTEIVCHKPLHTPEKAKAFIDYEVYLASGGDLKSSMRSAYPICRQLLTDKKPFSLARLVRKKLSKAGRSLYKRIPFKSVLDRWGIEKSNQREIAEWENQGKPLPPPHIVKQRTILEFAEQHDIRLLVETGTYLGEMVEAMKDKFDSVISIELSEELHDKATQRFASDKNVELIQGDSGIELEKLVSRIDQPAIFWLDGHYSAGITAMGEQATPIFKELRHIFNSKQAGHIIIVDDSRCFGTDPDYPTLESLREFVMAINPNTDFKVQDDSIRIVPKALATSSAA